MSDVSDKSSVGVSPTSGTAPPPEYRFPPGVSGNPKGRPSVGASAKEWMNVLDWSVAKGDLDEDGLRAIAADKKMAPSKRSAAERLLRMIERPNLADVEPLLDGQLSLRELRTQGVDTSIIKKVKSKRRILRKPYGEIEGEEIEREVELYDRSGEEFDRVCDRTDGKPTQRVDMKHDGSLRTVADGQAAADKAIAELQAALGNPAGDPAAVS